MSLLNLEDHEQHVPEFDNTFSSASPFFYFHHIIDAEQGTLKVEVIGPNLTFTFHHRHSSHRASLENKTVGFLAILEPTTSKRTVLGWAESGGGLGVHGDSLKATDPFVLSNALWTRRVLAVSKLFGLSMDHPFDGGRRPPAEAMRGTFLASHVEVKLAVHAVFVLLIMFGITDDFNNVTEEQLKKLQDARWQNGTQPEFEIYFSRRNCVRCAVFVGKLQEITGVPIQFHWKHRLTRVLYSKSGMGKYPPMAGAQAMVVEDDGIVDLTEDEEMIDLTDNAEDEQMVDLTSESDNTIAADSPIDLTVEHTEREASHPADSYLDGLAYCVGQFDEFPATARAAVVHLAESVLGRPDPAPEREAFQPAPGPA